MYLVGAKSYPSQCTMKRRKALEPSTSRDRIVRRMQKIERERKRENRPHFPFYASFYASVFLFTPHYLLSVYLANELPYKAVRGAADISTQAGSLETFELLARRARTDGFGRRKGSVARLSLSLSVLSLLGAIRRLAREKHGVVTGGRIEAKARGRAASRG